MKIKYRQKEKTIAQRDRDIVKTYNRKGSNKLFVREIAEMYGVSSPTVYRALKKFDKKEVEK